MSVLSVHTPSGLYALAYRQLRLDAEKRQLAIEKRAQLGPGAALRGQKNEICARHGLQLIRVENSYARRYHHIKGILKDFFESAQ